MTLFYLAVWKFPKISGRPQYCMHTLWCSSGVWPANICAKTGGAKGKSPYVRPSCSDLWHCLFPVETTLPRAPVLLKSADSLVGKPHLVFFLTLSL